MDGCPITCMPSACVVMGDQTINNCEIQLLLLQSSPRCSLAYARRPTKLATLLHYLDVGALKVLQPSN